MSLPAALCDRPRSVPPIAAIQIVVTPGSGDGRALTTAHAVRAGAEARGWPTELSAFDDVRHLSHWSASCAPTFSHLVSVGGDATMSAAASAAIRHRLPLVPVPSGFGNLFAQTSGHTDDVQAVLDTLDAGQVVWMDVGVSRGEVFLCHESFGLLHDVQTTVEQPGVQPRSRALRWLAYYRAGLRFLLGALPSSIRVEVDGALLTRRGMLVTVANVQAYGPFLSVTPEASPTDGLLDVFVIPRTTRLGLCRRLFKLLFRIPRRSDEAVMRQGRHVCVTLPGRRKREIRVMPAVLPVLVPPGGRDGASALPADAA